MLCECLTKTYIHDYSELPISYVHICQFTIIFPTKRLSWFKFSPIRHSFPLSLSRLFSHKQQEKFPTTLLFHNALLSPLIFPIFCYYISFKNKEKF